jgi:anaerobic nitric oxide reductase flavorubredoxin
MEAVKIAEDIYWVGAIDWNGRNFHGYDTPRGTSYNSFLILDEHPTLIDAVKAPFFSQLAQRIRSVIDPRKIEFIVSNHSEPDHASGLRMAQTLTGGAKIFCSKMGKEDLRMNFGDMDVTVVADGSEMNIGKHTLKFVYTQMVHWPDSMMTYVPEKGILFSMDAFGQHFASSKRFDDEVDEAVMFEEAEIYYANIILPYGQQVMQTFEKLKGLDLKLLATAHGVLWRKNIAKIMDKYVGYATYKTEPRAVVVYDTMWGSTQIMAEAIGEGIASEGVPVQVYRVTDTPRSTIMREVMMSRALVLGSPTLNNGMFPSVADIGTYIRGLKPKGHYAAVFNSYGWGAGTTKQMRELLNGSGMELPFEDIQVQFVPDEAAREKCREYGKQIARKILGRESAGLPQPLPVKKSP